MTSEEAAAELAASAVSVYLRTSTPNSPSTARPAIHQSDVSRLSSTTWAPTRRAARPVVSRRTNTA